MGELNQTPYAITIFEPLRMTWWQRHFGQIPERVCVGSVEFYEYDHDAAEVWAKQYMAELFPGYPYELTELVDPNIQAMANELERIISAETK